MKVDRRVAAGGVALGGLVLTATVLLALEVPSQGFLTLLFASSLFWFLLPFLALWVWRRLRAKEG